MADINYYICEELILNNLPIDGGSLETVLEQIAFSLYTNRDKKDYLKEHIFKNSERCGRMIDNYRTQTIAPYQLDSNADYFGSKYI